jgi:hypothetical protein
MSSVTALASEKTPVTFLNLGSGVIIVWVVFLFLLSSCTQQSTALSRPADEVEAITECDRNVVGEQDTEKRTKSDYVYDTLGRRWLIAHDRADEIIRCLVEQYGWIASIVPDGRAAVEAPH